jgi:hypothetical protein
VVGWQDRMDYPLVRGVGGINHESGGINHKSGGITAKCGGIILNSGGIPSEHTPV